MARYSSERKAALLKKLLPPINMSVAELARQENISEVTLYNWRKHARRRGSCARDNKLTDEWPAEAKFAVVLETAALSEIELSEYCRRKGLYPEQVSNGAKPVFWASNPLVLYSRPRRHSQGGQEAHPATRARVAS